MTQDAIVTKALNNGLAEVLVERGTACGDTCGSCEVCKYASEIRTYARNSLGAAEGDRVVIKTRSSEIIGAAFLLYIVTVYQRIRAKKKMIEFEIVSYQLDE